MWFFELWFLKLFCVSFIWFFDIPKQIVNLYCLGSFHESIWYHWFVDILYKTIISTFTRTVHVTGEQRKAFLGVHKFSSSSGSWWNESNQTTWHWWKAREEANVKKPTICANQCWIVDPWRSELFELLCFDMCSRRQAIHSSTGQYTMVPSGDSGDEQISRQLLIARKSRLGTYV